MKLTGILETWTAYVDRPLDHAGRLVANVTTVLNLRIQVLNGDLAEFPLADLRSNIVRVTIEPAKRPRRRWRR